METSEERYSRALADLTENYTAFHNAGAAAYCPGLEKTLTLSARLGNPHCKYRTIHVGGTNGKGSTAHTIAAVLQSAGLKTGLYTSPHILDFRERIRVNGKMICKDFVSEFMTKLGTIKGEFQPSYFEAVTLMAFDYFAADQIRVYDFFYVGQMHHTIQSVFGVDFYERTLGAEAKTARLVDGYFVGQTFFCD